jgi:hypothetical protein
MTTTLITDYLGAGVAASRPATPAVPVGGLAAYIATDTGVYSVWNGTVWITVSSSGVYAPLIAPTFTAPVNIGSPGAVLGDDQLQITATVDSYIQASVQNLSTGANASSNVVVLADDGDDSHNFAVLGINGSGYNVPTFTLGANPADHVSFLYSYGGPLVVGTGEAFDLVLFTGGLESNHERIRIDGTTGEITFPNNTKITSPNVGSATINWGATPLAEASFTVTDAAITTARRIQVFVDGSDTTGSNTAEDHQHAAASWQMTALAAAGSFTLKITNMLDLCSGSFVVRYVYT